MPNMNCWDFIKCPQETYKTCPAYPDKGLDCWKVTGTKCDKGKIETKTAVEKVEYCRKCSFYIHYAHKF
jgi:hypothetical protein